MKPQVVAYELNKLLPSNAIITTRPACAFSCSRHSRIACWMPSKNGHPVPTTFTSKIVSNGESSDVTMVLDEGSVKELAASPPPGRERVPVTAGTDARRPGFRSIDSGPRESYQPTARH
jgi:hypothetical protein